MKKQYKLPLEDVNEDSAFISKFLFDSGNLVRVGEIIYSFETTKTAADVEAENEGYIYYIVKEGANIMIGSVVCIITDDKNFDIQSIKKEVIGISSKEYKLTKEEEEISHTKFEIRPGKKIN